jgi:hypothetical protein
MFGGTRLNARGVLQRARESGTPLNYKMFIETLDDNVTPEAAARAYEGYKQGFAMTIAANYWEEHMNDGWARDRYDPEVLERRWAERVAYATNEAHAFLHEMATGSLLLTSFDADDYTLERREEEAMEDGEHMKIRVPVSGSPHVIVIRQLAKQVTREALLELLLKTDGFIELAIGDPDESGWYDGARTAWAHYASEESVMNALGQLVGAAIGSAEVRASRMDPDAAMAIATHVKIAPFTAQREARLAHDLEQLTRVVAHMNKEKGLAGDADVIAASGPAGWAALTTKAKLDRLLAFARRVHLYCYYCGIECFDIAELRHRCGSVHVRASSET